LTSVWGGAAYIYFPLLFEILGRRTFFAEEKADIIQSPKQALVVAESCLKLNDPGNALEWIGKSVDRGLQSYTTLTETGLSGMSTFPARIWRTRSKSFSAVMKAKV
jgi:hypothetical protein